MYLVDNEIQCLINRGYGIIEGFDKKSLGAISYDMHIEDVIYLNGCMKKANDDIRYLLYSMEPVIVKLKEKIKVPNDGIIKITPRNCAIRMGIEIDAPIYQPGHETYCFIRVMNITKDPLILSKGESICQAMFGKLNFVPDHLYGSTKNHSKYQNEKEYIQE